jgi:hypothetical protein
MNGFRNFVILAVFCIIFALAYQAAGCDVSKSLDGCTWNVDTKTYSCPNER